MARRRRRGQQPASECPTGKQRWQTRAGALLVAHQFAMRVYRCPQCDGWHCTSRVNVGGQRRPLARRREERTDG